ncbi:MAG: hypothetical protein HEQ40_02255 [Lacibacter sp.]|jgi:hypothetical protein
MYLVSYKVEVNAQSKSSAAFYRLVNSGKKNRDKFVDTIYGTGWLQYRDSIISGDFLLSKIGLQLKQKNDRRRFGFVDTLVRKVVIKSDSSSLYLNRLVYYDNQLWRLVKDTLGIEIYDKSLDLNSSAHSINYNSLLFRKDTLYIPAVTFWVTSTKRSIILIMNNLLGNTLKPNEFRSKEDYMEQLLQNSKHVWGISKNKP